MAYLVPLVFILAYGFGLFYWNRQVTWRLNPRMSRSIKLFHYAGLLICLLVGITYMNFDIGLRGLWTTRSIVISVLVTGVLFILLTDKSTISHVERWYFRTFSLLPVLAAATLLIPFFGIVLMLSLFGQLTDPATIIYYEDDKLRIQSSFVGVLGPPRLDIFEKRMIFERKLQSANLWANDIDSIKVFYDSDSTRIIAFGLYDYDEERQGETKTICLRRLK